MSALLLFNPDTDLALASGDAHYTPPASALTMARDMQEFPCLWAGPADVVMLADGRLVDASGRRLDQALPDVASSLTAVRPWGWNPLLVSRLRKAGLPDRLLPTDAQMAAYRAWASRHTAVGQLNRLRHEWPDAFAEGGLLVGESAWCTSEPEVKAALLRFGPSVLKAPWSGSGRGVRFLPSGTCSPKDADWVRRVLRQQGGVEAEPLYNKRQDFAMEFVASGGQVRYEGLSVFSTNHCGVYSGNLVAPEHVREARLTATVPATLLHEVRQRVLRLLNMSQLPEWYAGPVGVDMMVVDGGRLHPLVEINLRATMGWVAVQLARRLSDGQTMLFTMANSDGHYGFRLDAI